MSGHRNFARYVMSDVYALLDYLSGRASPSLAASSHMPARLRRSAAHNDDGQLQLAQDVQSIDQDLSDQNNLLCRAMRIGERLDDENADISFADAAFLISARDLLNFRAAPATGSSISFTIRVVGRLLAKQHHDSPRTGYIVPDKALEDAAAALAIFVAHKIAILISVLVVTSMLSIYVAWGKLLLDAQDAVNRDYGANISAIVSHYDKTEFAPDTAAQETGDLIDEFCKARNTNILVSQSCHQRHELVERRKTIYELLSRWESPFFHATSGEAVDQWAGTAIGVLGNYLLPVLYGALGSLGFVLRRLNRQLADFLLTPRDLRASVIRIVLGTVTGACIGLFVNSSAGAATLTGLGGAAVTLSASGVAFLAGYGVEGVFKMLDAAINHAFKINGDHRDGDHA